MARILPSTQPSKLLAHLEIYRDIVESVKQFSTCLSRKNSAILLSPNKSIIATGYNGPPRGVPHCSVCLRKENKSGENLEKCRAAHAELNTIANCAAEGIRTLGCTLICSTQPCMSCAKVIINAGIVRVIYFEPYNAPEALKLLEEGGIVVYCPRFE